MQCRWIIMLKQTHKTLPADHYFDAEHYQRELRAIWQRDWICIGHQSEWRDEGYYRVIELGDLRAFHNTCRHRGSLLCEHNTGRFRNNRITCPYHAWSYSLDGDLTQTPRRIATDDFNPDHYSLYPVAVDTLSGFVFVNLADEPDRILADTFGQEMETLSNWPLTGLEVAHEAVHDIQCNWKVFWENFLECYHCPGVHPALSRLVPMYGAGFNALSDVPASTALKRQFERSRLVNGAVTWSADGQTPLPWFEGLTDAERSVGMTFAVMRPGLYVVAHVDYVRAVLVQPRGPEKTRLLVKWLLHGDTLRRGRVDISRLTGFGEQVVMEDARVCELNQQGLHCLRHRTGALVPQEYDIKEFNDWVIGRLYNSAE